MQGKFIKFGRSVISLILCFALFATGIQLPARAETAGATPMLVSGVKTWQDAAEYVCGLLGEYPGNALNALKEWNYLEADVAPQDEVSAEQMQTLLSRVFGAVIDGYSADMTRTVAVGEPTDEMRGLYELVRRAKDTATLAVAPGIACAEVDAVARRVIAEGGYADEFCHGLGHSIGLEGHEDPRFRADSNACVEEGLVMSVEPGVYLPGRLGLRIEDLIYVGPDGVESLNETATDLVVLA